MTRSCDGCGREYVAKRPTSRFCGGTCRTRASRAGGVAAVPRSVPSVVATSGVVAATRRELEDAGRLGSMLGEAALELATSIASPHESGSSKASMVKQLVATMAEALKGTAAADPLDELRGRRDAKRHVG